jgi:hypothetical protein
VNILWAGKRCEKLCDDLLDVHQKKCTLGKILTFSHLASDEITNLRVKLCNHYRATWTLHTISWDVVALDLSGLSLVGLVHGMQHVRCLCAWLLATGGMPMSVVRFSLQV